MRRLSIAAFSALNLLVSMAAAQSTAPAVAEVFGAAFTCPDANTNNDSRECATHLLRHVRAKVAEMFVTQHGLNATSAELERLTSYNQAFERHDRSQRARKLAELEARLADEALPPSERSRLEAFRDTLSRLARYEAETDAGTEPVAPLDEKTLRGYIETAKLNAALYARYGGTIGITAYGPYAHGAMRALILEHMQRGTIRILDSSIAAHFLAALETPPRLIHTDGEPDFTPFWERSIPPSYMRDY